MKNNLKIRKIVAMLAVMLSLVFMLSACEPEYLIGYEDGYRDGVQTISLKINFIIEDEIYHEVEINDSTEEDEIFPETPAKEGYYFLGWYLDKDDFKRPFTNLDILLFGELNGKVDVFARFDEKPGLIINQIYGLGDKSDDSQAGSHSFVELYNTNDLPIDLNGYSVQSATNGTDWQKLDLQGTIPAKSSFLIVLNKYTNTSARLIISEYDMLWQDAYFPNKDLKVALLNSTELLTFANPFDYNDLGAKVLGYVDMIGVAGNDEGRSIDGYETDYLGGRTAEEAAQGQSKQRAVRRLDFKDTDNNAEDVEIIDYRSADLNFRPRSSSFGAWINIDDEGIAFEMMDFPALYVDTENAATITSKEIYTSAVVSMRNIDEDFCFENTAAEIRGRGNTTWDLDKKPYRLKFKESRPMLNSGYQARDWTLIACHSDKSFMRSYGAYYLASSLEGMYFSPSAWFIDLYLNGSYQGVYMLSDQIQQNEGRADLVYDANPELCEYLLEWDVRAPSEGIEDEDWVSMNGSPIAIKFPSGSSLTAEHVSYIKEYLTAFDDILANGNYGEIEGLIKEESFIDYFLVQELFRNVDIADLSIWFQVKGAGENRKLEMGPVWDFDISLGNVNYSPNSPQGLWAQSQNRWFRNLMSYSEFSTKLVNRWNEIKDNQIREIILHIELLAVTYETAFERNFMVWDILGEYVWPNPPQIVEIDTFLGQVEFLVNFLNTRIGWLDDNYSSLNIHLE